MRIGQFRIIFELIRSEFRSNVEAQFISLLLAVIEYEQGITHTELAKQVGMSQPATSKNCKILGVQLKRSAKGGFVDQGLGLIEERVLQGSTQKAVFLTKKGKSLAAKIEKALKTYS